MSNCKNCGHPEASHEERRADGDPVCLREKRYAAYGHVSYVCGCREFVAQDQDA